MKLRTEPRVVRMVRAFIAAINAHDLDALAALMSDDHTFIDSAGKRTTGRDEVLSGWHHYLRLFPDYAVQIGSMLHHGAVVAAFGTWTAIYASTRGYNPQNAVGGPAAWRAVVRSGRVSTWQVFADHTRTVEVITRAAEPSATSKP